LFEKSGLSSILKDLVNGGLVYAGDSAGSAVLGPDMHGLDLLDSPREAPEVIYGGLGLTSFMTLPHWGNERYAAEIQSTKEELEKYNNEIITINDDQAIIVNGSNTIIVGLL
jgi:dipeptidase E